MVSAFSIRPMIVVSRHARRTTTTRGTQLENGVLPSLFSGFRRLSPSPLPSSSAFASGLSFDDGGADDEDDEDDSTSGTAKWEEMYRDNEVRKELISLKGGTSTTSSTLSTTSTVDSEIRVVTFDLDNTLWKTSEVISAANDALAVYMESQDVRITKRVEVTMGELFRDDPAKYIPSLHDDNANTDTTDTKTPLVGKAPVLLSQLRKDAIHKSYLEHPPSTPTPTTTTTTTNDERARSFADDAFQTWTTARHAAIPSHLAPSLLPTLQTIRALRTSSSLPITIGAITDGNSDPRLVECLAPFFDFCVNAEVGGVGKPDRRIYGG